MQDLIANIIILLCRILYKKTECDILSIKGHGKEYPRYLLFTENENVYKRMDRF